MSTKLLSLDLAQMRQKIKVSKNQQINIQLPERYTSQNTKIQQRPRRRPSDIPRGHQIHAIKTFTICNTQNYKEEKRETKI